jgi:hypothetical protein
LHFTNHLQKQQSQSKVQNSFAKVLRIPSDKEKAKGAI